MIQDWYDPEFCLEAVKRDGHALGFVKNQTPEICLQAVKQNGFAIRFVINQTPEICLEAVKRNGCALEYVKEQTSDICLEAIKRNGLAIEYIKEQTPLLIHYLKKYNITIYESLIYESFTKENRITISDNEMKKFYNENPHLLLTL